MADWYGDRDNLPSPERVRGGLVRCVHEYYGCDSGCCGQRILVLREDSEVAWRSSFDFLHELADDARMIAGRLRLPVEIEPDAC